MSARINAMEDDLQRLHAWLTNYTGRGPSPSSREKTGTWTPWVRLLRSLQPIPICWLVPPHRPGGGTVCRQASGAVSNLGGGHTSWPKQLAAVVVVDAAAPDQTGLSLPSVPLCVIDHHATDAWELGEDDLGLKWDTRSTTEVVAAYLEQHARSALSLPVCEFLLAGLRTDTARFRHANGRSFNTAARLIERSGLDYQAFIQEMEDAPTTPQRPWSHFERPSASGNHGTGPWTILRTTAGTLEGRVASILNGLGADAVVETRSRNGSTRLTVRAPRSSVLAGLHMGHLMEEVAQSIGGEGGGHDGAAGWSGDAHPIAAETAFIDAVARTARSEVNS